MNLLCLCSGLASLFLVAAPARVDSCDMKSVVKAAWCTKDKVLLDRKDLVSNATYYACPVCGRVQKDPGKCAKDSKDLQMKTSDAEVCPTCFQKTETVDACEKAYWECDACRAHALKEGNCEKCQAPMKRHTSLAQISYRCEACGFKSDKAGSCPAKTAEECKSFGKPLARVCSKSGTFPHVGS